jgi:hypothetical protein
MTECPKCGYTRTKSDITPDYECPQCGVIYEKYVRAQADKAERAAAQAAAQREREVQAALRAAKKANKNWAANMQPRPAGTRFKLPGLWTIIGSVVLISFFASPPPADAPREAAAPSQPAQARQMTPEEQVAAAVARQEELERKKIEAFVTRAREVCSSAIKNHATFPSTVDIAWFFGTGTQRAPNSTRVRMEFTAKNALGVELPFVGDCLVNDLGALNAFKVRNR